MQWLRADPEKYAVWERYGNMDGPGAMQVGIALPSWLVDPQNSTFIVAAYAIALLLVLVFVYLYVSEQRKKMGNVSMETMAIFFRSITDTHE